MSCQYTECKCLINLKLIISCLPCTQITLCNWPNSNHCGNDWASSPPLNHETWQPSEPRLPQHHHSFITAPASAHSLTCKKFLWPMIYSLADFEAEVVSNFIFVLLHYHYHVSNISFLSDEFWWQKGQHQWWHPSECSVDCINCKVQEKGRDFALYKFALKSGLRYEVVVGIVMGEWSGSMVYILAASTLMSKFSMPPCWVVKMILKELRLMMGTSERAHSGLKGMVPKAVFLRLTLKKSADLFLADTLFLANNWINSAICEDRLICESVLFLCWKYAYLRS